MRQVLLLAAALVAASLPASTQSPPIAGLAHVAIAVHDLGASEAFYNRLGFEEAFHFGEGDALTQVFLKINDTQFIELYPATAKQPAGFLHLCFEGSDLNALHDFDVSRGLAPIAVRKARAGNLLFTLEGPERQNIEYTQYLPGSLHSNDRGQHLGQDRIATSIFAVSLAMRDPAAAKAFYVEKLGFLPVPHHPMLLAIPGSSGQQIVFGSAAELPHARTFFHVASLATTASRLKQLRVDVIRSPNALSVSDPDGNVLVFESGPDAEPAQR